MNDERVLTITRKVLFGENNERYFEGFVNRGEIDFESIIFDSKNYRFLLRHSTDENQILPCEEDENFKQIIPYVVFKAGDKVFIYKRLRASGESRLVDLFSIGIGGHISHSDFSDSVRAEDFIIQSLLREFNEEVRYDGDYSIKLLGFINEEQSSVGKVHFGIVFLIEAARDFILVKEKDKISGKLVNLKEVENESHEFETWSKLVWDFVKNLN